MRVSETPPLGVNGNRIRVRLLLRVVSETQLPGVNGNKLFGEVIIAPVSETPLPGVNGNDVLDVDDAGIVSGACGPCVEYGTGNRQAKEPLTFKLATTEMRRTPYTFVSDGP